MQIDTNLNLTVKSIDDKWADVTCELCGQTERIKRVEIYTINRLKTVVKCVCEEEQNEETTETTLYNSEK